MLVLRNFWFCRNVFKNCLLTKLQNWSLYELILSHLQMLSNSMAKEDIAHKEWYAADHFWKHFGKRRHCLNWVISPFAKYFWIYSIIVLPYIVSIFFTMVNSKWIATNFLYAGKEINTFFCNNWIIVITFIRLMFSSECWS